MNQQHEGNNMPDRRSVFTPLIPVVAGFVLATVSSVAISLIVTRDGVQDNSKDLAAVKVELTEMNTYMRTSQEVSNRVSILEIKQANMVVTGDDIKTLLRKNEAVMRKLDTTLTILNTSYEKEIASINKRLDKAGF